MLSAYVVSIMNIVERRIQISWREEKKTSRPRIVESKFRCNIRLILHFALRTLPNNFHYRIPSLANSEQQESETERIDQCPSLPEKTPSLSSFKPGTRPPSSPQPCSANFLGSCLFYFYFPQRPSYFHARGTRYSPGITSLINLVVITPLLVCKASGAGRSADRKTSFNVNVAGRASRFVAFSTLFTDEGEKEREEKKKKKKKGPDRWILHGSIVPRSRPTACRIVAFSSPGFLFLPSSRYPVLPAPEQRVLRPIVKTVYAANGPPLPPRRPCSREE